MPLFGRRESKKVDSAQILLDLKAVCQKYLGDRTDSVLQSSLSSIGRDASNLTVDDISPLINKLIDNVINPLKKADFRAELFEIRRKYSG
ncbi:MAG: hypothetical protein N2380_09560 [bacterium]|nr:hypothetical protein [bacterium]